MSDEAKERAEELAERPDVKRWIKRLKKLSAEMPKCVYVFCEDGTPHVMARKPNREPYETDSGGEDQDAIIDSANPCDGSVWDGGGW